MVFNEECKLLDHTKMKSQGVLKDAAINPVSLEKKICLAKDEWIYDCPEGCSDFKQK